MCQLLCQIVYIIKFTKLKVAFTSDYNSPEKPKKMPFLKVDDQDRYMQIFSARVVRMVKQISSRKPIGFTVLTVIPERQKEIHT